MNISSLVISWTTRTTPSPTICRYSPLKGNHRRAVSEDGANVNAHDHSGDSDDSQAADGMVDVVGIVINPYESNT